MSNASFTIPAPELKPMWRKYCLAVAAGVGLSFFVRPGFAGMVGALGSAAIGSALLYATYQGTLRHVWVTLSQEGIVGRGETHRDLVFGWHEPVVLVETSKFGFKGVVVRRSEDDGLIRARVAPLFIPEPVLGLESFRAALARLAPASHPLRQKVGRAT